MRRGTTPTIVFTCPFSVAEATKLNIAFAQNDKVILERSLSGVTINNKKITVHLSQWDTLKLSACKGGLDMQIRLELNGEMLASNIMHTTVSRILKDGIL